VDTTEAFSQEGFGSPPARKTNRKQSQPFLSLVGLLNEGEVLLQKQAQAMKIIQHRVAVGPATGLAMKVMFAFDSLGHPGKGLQLEGAGRRILQSAQTIRMAPENPLLFESIETRLIVSLEVLPVGRPVAEVAPQTKQPCLHAKRLALDGEVVCFAAMDWDHE
jgi:hypothetical protein